MAQFLLTHVLMVSVGVILYLLIRALPRVKSSDLPSKTSLFERWVASEIPEKLDAGFNTHISKVLRRCKIMVLKLDNALNVHLKKVKPVEDSSDKLEGLQNVLNETKEGIDQKE